MNSNIELRDDFRLFNDPEELEATTFVIDNDHKADWALRKIAEEYAERDRLADIAQAQITELEERLSSICKQCDSRTAFLKAKLSDYFDAVPHKETKTQETYALLAGKLKMKKATHKLVQNESQLISWLKETGNTEYVKTIEKPAWGDIKTLLEVVDGKVIIKDTGELVQGVTVEVVPASFDVTFTK